jgi:hypothetical protein
MAPLCCRAEVERQLSRAARRFGKRTPRQDIVGALIDAATPTSTAKTLRTYNLKLGKALAALDTEE